jgi:S1-C subfamily serine protease
MPGYDKRKFRSASVRKQVKEANMHTLIYIGRRRLLGTLVAVLWAASGLSALAASDPIADTIPRVKPAIVGVGTFMKTRSPALQFVATGFAVADGRHIVTNAHAVDKALDTERLESRIVLVAKGDEVVARKAEITALDREHDLALLSIEGEPLPALKLGDSAAVREGRTLAFTGFPIGMVLGFHPSTHRGMVAAITPVALPVMSAQQLNPRVVSRIRETPYKVFQLDAVAYPGNSGSPLYDTESGVVYGVINSTFVQGTRENAISRPSGISYAIPSIHIRNLLQANNVPVSD